MSRNASSPTAPDPQAPFPEQFKALREKFRTSTIKTLDAFRALALQLAAAPTSPEVLDALRRELHRIRGTAGSYGYEDASQLAGKLEERAVRWVAEPTLDTNDRATMIAHFVSVLEVAFEVGSTGVAGDTAAAARSTTASGAPIPRKSGQIPSPDFPDVILVEDDVALSEMLQFGLRSAGYTYQAYATGPEALAALLRMRIGKRAGARRPLVLLDVDLPGLDGHSLHERLRVERPGAFSVVFQSAHGSETEQLRALTNGALDYVVKPLNLRVFLAKVPIWLRQAGADPAPV